MRTDVVEDTKIHVIIKTDSNGSNKVHIHDDDDDVTLPKSQLDLLDRMIS